MTSEEEKSLMYAFQGKQALTLIKKGGDYANADVLSNFKIQAKILDLLGVNTKTPQGTCLSLIVLKLIRYCNLRFSDKTPNNESLEDTLLDLSNYSFLLKALDEDENKQEVMDGAEN